MKKINLNQKVKVKITKKGRDYLKEINQLINRDKDGYTTLQLWELMGIFGETMQHPTFSPVIEPDIFLLEED